MREIWNNLFFKEGIFETWWGFLSSIHDRTGPLYVSSWHLHNLSKLLQNPHFTVNTCLQQLYIVYCLATARRASLKIPSPSLKHRGLWPVLSRTVHFCFYLRANTCVFLIIKPARVAGTVNICQLENLKVKVMFALLHINIFNPSEKSFWSDGNYERVMRMMICPIWFTALV